MKTIKKGGVVSHLSQNSFTKFFPDMSLFFRACAKTWTMDWTMDDGRWTMDLDDGRPSSRF